MKAIYIYNPHDAREVALKDRAMQDIGNIVDEVEVCDFMKVREIYKIKETPALIVIREDFQGKYLMTEDIENGKLRLAGELLRIAQEEEQNIHNISTPRIDNYIKAEVELKVKEFIEGVGE